MAGPLGVTHFLLLSASPNAPYLRVARTPRGPTLTFRVCAYSLAADVANAQTRPRVPPGIFDSPPLVSCDSSFRKTSQGPAFSLPHMSPHPFLFSNTLSLSLSLSLQSMLR